MQDVKIAKMLMNFSKKKQLWHKLFAIKENVEPLNPGYLGLGLSKSSECTSSKKLTK